MSYEASPGEEEERKNQDGLETHNSIMSKLLVRNESVSSKEMKPEAPVNQQGKLYIFIGFGVWALTIIPYHS